MDKFDIENIKTIICSNCRRLIGNKETFRCDDAGFLCSSCIEKDETKETKKERKCSFCEKLSIEYTTVEDLKGNILTITCHDCMKEMGMSFINKAEEKEPDGITILEIDSMNKSFLSEIKELCEDFGAKCRIIHQEIKED
jgi:RNase P subunit RPR2